MFTRLGVKPGRLASKFYQDCNVSQSGWQHKKNIIHSLSMQSRMFFWEEWTTTVDWKLTARLVPAREQLGTCRPLRPGITDLAGRAARSARRRFLKFTRCQCAMSLSLFSSALVVSFLNVVVFILIEWQYYPSSFWERKTCGRHPWTKKLNWTVEVNAVFPSLSQLFLFSHSFSIRLQQLKTKKTII